jgi:hypothetical protein
MAQTRSSGLRELQDTYTEIVTRIRGVLFRGLSPEERAIYDDIEFRITLDDNPSPSRARALRRDGDRLVELSVGYARTLDMIVDAAVIGEERGDEFGFVNDYVTNVLERWRTNWDRNSKGLPNLRIPTPYDFANLTPRQTDRLESDPRLNQKRNGVFGNALAFVLGHEVGHHVLGHLESRPVDKAESRRREAAADAWSIHLMLRNGANPLGGAYALLFDYLAGDNLGQELASTHPADIRRIQAMYAETKSDQRAVAKLASSLGISTARLNQQIDETLARIEAVLERN